MANESTNFWLRLLVYFDDEVEQQRIWNDLCRRMINAIPPKLADKETSERLFERLNTSEIYDGSRLQLFSKLEAELGKEHELPVFPPNESYMDFSGTTFPNDVSFDGRVLIGADFCRATFEKGVYRFD